MQTSALFGVKNFGFFKIYGVFARTRGRRSIFRNFVWTAPKKITISLGK